MINKIKNYTLLNGVSGNEGNIRKLIKESFIRDGNTNIINDNLGSICTKIEATKKDAKNIGIFAHMDEVGFMISQILDDGNVKVVNIGGISVKDCLGQKVILNINDSEYVGVFLSNYEKEIKELTVSDLIITFGFDDKEEVIKKGFEVGEYLYFKSSFDQLQNDVYSVKALDNRIGCAIVDELSNIYKINNTNYNIFLGATVQEEVGLRGASSILNKIGEEMDEIIIVDVSPIDNKKENKLGEGFLLRIAEPRGIYDVDFNNDLKRIAKKNNIKYQEYFSKGRTDGHAMQMVKNGNKVAAVCTPALNLHSANTVFSYKDVLEGIKIIRRYIEDE